MSERKKVVLDNHCEIITMQCGETSYSVDLLVFCDITTLRGIAKGMIKKDPNRDKFKIDRYDHDSLIDLIRILHTKVPISESMITKYNNTNVHQWSTRILSTLVLLAIVTCMVIIAFAIGIAIGSHSE
jgi:hypothetical protein